MSVNVLLEKSDMPTDERIKAILGGAWPLYEELRGATQACAQEWKHYGKKYGWKLKVHANDKTLFELTVAQGWFLVAMAIREKERLELMADPSLASSSLASLDVASPPAPPAQPAQEGYGIKVEVRDAASYGRTMSLVRFIMAQRKL